MSPLRRKYELTWSIKSSALDLVPSNSVGGEPRSLSVPGPGAAAAAGCGFGAPPGGTPPGGPPPLPPLPPLGGPPPLGGFVAPGFFVMRVGLVGMGGSPAPRVSRRLAWRVSVSVAVVVAILLLGMSVVLSL